MTRYKPKHPLEIEDPAVIYELRRSGVCFSEMDEVTYIWASTGRRRLLRANVLAWRWAQAHGLRFDPSWNIPGFNPDRARLRGAEDGVQRLPPPRKA